jgi:hypothetical protein
LYMYVYVCVCVCVFTPNNLHFIVGIH